MNWNDLEIKSTSKFLKIEDGKPQTIRLIGEGSERVIHGFGKEETVCSGNGCLICSSGSENSAPKQRFKANVYNWTTNKVHLWDFGPGIAKQLKEIAKSLASEQKDMESIDLKISVSGTGMQKKYTIMPWPSTKELPPGLAVYDLDSIPF